MRFSELEGRRLAVWGGGREIASLTKALDRLPAARIELAVFDSEPSARELAALPAGVRVAVGPAAARALRDCEVLVRSPGVSLHRPELRSLADAGRLTTATSLWLCEHGPANVLAVTGTKGKSTTAALAAALARAAGVRTALAGNIGVPALELLGADPPPELVVLELSSYQIADLRCGAEAVVFANLFREHLDWHGSEASYRAEKLRLLSLPGVRTALLNGRDRALVASAREVLASTAEVRLFGVPAGWDVTEQGIVRAGELIVPAAQLPLRGAHNALNLCAALAGLEALGVAPPALDALTRFQPLPHRLQEVPGTGGITWIDDSISTTPESALAALDSFAGRPVVLIGGGQDRGQDYRELAAELARRDAGLVGIPTTGPRLVAQARGAGLAPDRALPACDLAEAVSLARALAAQLSGAAEQPVVLLSPAAPSYDSFRDFEERGERFAALAAGAGS